MIMSLRERIAKKGYVLNGYLTIPSAFGAEAYARLGWDSVTLDLEHGMIGPDMALQMIQATTASGILTMCRVPWLDPSIIMKVLDAGALGIICPMINTAEDAARLVHYIKYPPAGERSMGPLRAKLVYGDDYAKFANDAITILPMIETAEAVKNIEAIAAVPGITGVYIGAFDLASSMGRPAGRGMQDPEVANAVDQVFKHCRKSGLVVGMMAADGEKARALVDRGFEFVGIATDVSAMAAQVGSWIQTVAANR
jgi:4-hydroxy-2-oxoheptanedioate aldolase